MGLQHSIDTACLCRAGVKTQREHMVLQCIAVCCSVLQCAAVCCIVLHCVAVCCRVLQCVAVCCSKFQFVEVQSVAVRRPGEKM